MSERDFEIGSVKFKLNKVDAMRQFHIVRRMGPLLADLIPAMQKAARVSKNKEVSDDQKFDDLAELAAPFMTGISKLSDDDANKIIYGLLSSVEMLQESGNWARVATDSGLMFQNIEFPVMMQAAAKALMYNLGNFFSAIPQVSHGDKPKQKGR